MTYVDHRRARPPPATGRSLLEQLEREEAQRLEAMRETPTPDFAPGDTVRVNVRIREGERERIQAFEGVCIARAGGGINESFTVRKISFGEGVERLFPVLSPAIESIVVQRRGVVRRAKLYYLRDRRGKAARIAERRVGPAPNDAEGVPLPRDPPLLERGGSPDVHEEPDTVVERSERSSLAYDREPKGGIDDMVAALKQLQALKGEAEGPRARAAVISAVALLPDGPQRDARRADAYTLALSLGEHLCPLMFSPDKEIARNARAGLEKLVPAVSERTVPKGLERLALVLGRLGVAIVIEISIRPRRGAAEVTLKARDVVFAAAQRPGLDHVVRLQLLLEDMGEEVIETLGEANLGPKGDEVVTRNISGDRDHLGAKLITLLADGREVFRAKLTRPAERVLVI